MNWSNSWPKNEKEVGVDNWLQTATNKAVASLEGYEQREFEVTVKTDPIKVTAYVVGDLAVCKAVDVGKKGYQILHIPSMAWIDKAVPNGLHPLKALLVWCHKVQNPEMDQLKDDWRLLATLNHDNYYDDNKIVMDAKIRLLEWCLSVKVEV